MEEQIKKERRILEDNIRKIVKKLSEENKYKEALEIIRLLDDILFDRFAKTVGWYVIWQVCTDKIVTQSKVPGEHSKG